MKPLNWQEKDKGFAFYHVAFCKFNKQYKFYISNQYKYDDKEPDKFIVTVHFSQGRDTLQLRPWCESLEEAKKACEKFLQEEVDCFNNQIKDILG